MEGREKGKRKKEGGKRRLGMKRKERTGERRRTEGNKRLGMKRK